MNHLTYFEDIGAWPAGKKPHAVWPAYVLGLILSLALTFAAFMIATDATLSISKAYLFAALIILAALQFIVQISFFFHLGFERSAHERLAIFGATIVIVTIVLSGSIWIMRTLDHRMMPDTAQMMEYMQRQPGL